MFEVTVASIPDAERQLLGSLSQSELSALRSQLTLATTSAPTPIPSCQLAYHEVSDEFVDQLFSYAGIAQHNGAVGLAGSFAPIFRPPELVVFPVSGLLSHLEANFQPQLAPLLAQGEPERFLTGTTEYGTAEAFLLAGTLACAHLASRFPCALVIRW